MWLDYPLPFVTIQPFGKAMHLVVANLSTVLYSVGCFFHSSFGRNHCMTVTHCACKHKMLITSAKRRTGMRNQTSTQAAIVDRHFMIFMCKRKVGLARSFDQILRLLSYWRGFVHIPF